VDTEPAAYQLVRNRMAPASQAQRDLVDSRMSLHVELHLVVMLVADILADRADRMAAVAGIHTHRAGRTAAEAGKRGMIVYLSTDEIDLYQVVLLGLNGAMVPELWR
jgi:hypothetical protein